MIKACGRLILDKILCKIKQARFSPSLQMKQLILQTLSCYLFAFIL